MKSKFSKTFAEKTCKISATFAYNNLDYTEKKLYNIRIICGVWFVINLKEVFYEPIYMAKSRIS